MEAKKITVIGNAGAGKTTFSRRLAELYPLPLIHIDSIQFLPGMRIRPHAESIAILRPLILSEKWIMDGYGPLDILLERLEASDRIIFIDFPLWRHFWWCTKRQIKNAWKQRTELPSDCNEFTLNQTFKLFRTLFKVHQKMRPEMIKILNKDSIRSKVIFIHDYDEWIKRYEHGIN